MKYDYHAGFYAYEQGLPFDADKSLEWQNGWLFAKDFWTK